MFYAFITLLKAAAQTVGKGKKKPLCFCHKIKIVSLWC